MTTSEKVHLIVVLSCIAAAAAFFGLSAEDRVLALLFIGGAALLVLYVYMARVAGLTGVLLVNGAVIALALTARALGWV